MPIILFYSILVWVKYFIKKYSRPPAETVFFDTQLYFSRSRMQLIAENAMLRQQLLILRRQVIRPRISRWDRLRLLFFARFTPLWKQSLHIIQPETLLHWHRDLFRIYWRRKSRASSGEPRISPQTIKLIRQMSEQNRLWGAERIRGELLKLGIRVSKRSIQKFMRTRRIRSGQSWATFLNNHAGDIWACDFTTVHTLFFKSLYIFVIEELKNRKIVHAAVTDAPTDRWVAQQLREATPWNTRPKFLIRDRDSKFGSEFASAAVRRGIQVLKTPYRAPKANAFCERLIGSLKRECLDHVLILNQGHLKRALSEYVHYYNQSRPHQGIRQRRPKQFDDSQTVPSMGRIVSKPVLGGLHHNYSRASYFH